METADDDADLKLVKASATLLADLEGALPKLLWRPSRDGAAHGRVHTRVKQKDLDYVIKLIEPFQGEPQLLDASLKHIVPPIVEAYLEYLLLGTTYSPNTHPDLQSAVCIILYTLCKVRGSKVIVGFFNNEPRHFEAILNALENTLLGRGDGETQTEWQVPYVLFLWLAHLLLTPFDLASISAQKYSEEGFEGLELPRALPSLVIRVLRVGMAYLPTSTKGQDAAAALLVRVVARPDMQKLKLPDVLVAKALNQVQVTSSDVPVTIYERLGTLRFLTGVATSADLAHLIPDIYRTCEELSNDEDNPAINNAVAKKLMVKTFRNIAILCLRSASADGPLLSFLETAGVLENVIDHLLRSLGDRDTPVRYAAAKAISLIVLELEPGMGHEVIQAVLDTFKEDMPTQGSALDFRTANALRWHGLTLALAHALFKRTASPEQLPDIVNALVSALQFEQRTATGSSLGTNVRDAANFGIWSMSRRYTTAELLMVDSATLRFAQQASGKSTVIQVLAIQLILSACLDPAGNIRRGSSAALQELIGRHPNQVYEGIALVQIVEYQAVGLRRRAIVDVVCHAADRHEMYWQALLDGLLGWRGLGSADVTSREAAADSAAKLSLSQYGASALSVLDMLLGRLSLCVPSEAEALHGLVLALACCVEVEPPSESARISKASLTKLWNVITRLPEYLGSISPRVLRSELPAAAARMITALCRAELGASSESQEAAGLPFDSVEVLLERLLSRQEESILLVIPSLVQTVLALRRKAGVALGCLGAQTLTKKVTIDGAKSTMSGAGRALALGALAGSYGSGLSGEKAGAAINALAGLVQAMSVDWRIIGARGLQLAVKDADADAEHRLDHDIANSIVDAVQRGMRDYTIDERGDVGSLVRLQAILCASSILDIQAFRHEDDATPTLHTELARLSLEKLDRVRMAAAQCRREYLGFQIPVTDIASVSTFEYCYTTLQPLRASVRNTKLDTAVLEGCISCAGLSAEPLLQASRAALADTLYDTDMATLCTHLSAYAAVLKAMLLENGNNTHPALELLAFLLDMQIPQRLSGHGDFKWRNLLSTVQKSHHKSNDIPKITAAVHVYRGLADVPSIRNEVLKKLFSMLKTNPYPRIRTTVADTLFSITGDESLGPQNWAAPIVETKVIVAQLEQKYIVR
ncbi:hypothetical protein LTR36_004218 [Oleoguttula mirabilis]|uniref:Tubulin-specific chaperone D n=1 Tax=Oleoguttula mirabilis TaxID=1507867 RepID=A0AAV9JGW0_9PEZI|nr:hypothetical protein LTR36_004218 [Oleoguttula mirabilis]